jgi:hypothetical protein
MMMKLIADQFLFEKKIDIDTMCGSKKKPTQPIMKKKAVIGQHWFQASSLFGFARLVFSPIKKCPSHKILKGK